MEYIDRTLFVGDNLNQYDKMCRGIKNEIIKNS